MIMVIFLIRCMSGQLPDTVKNIIVNYHFFQQLTSKQEVSLREYKRRRIVKWELHPVIVCCTRTGSLPGETSPRVSTTW